MLLVDTNVLLDVLEDDPVWVDWSLIPICIRNAIYEFATPV